MESSEERYTSKRKTCFLKELKVLIKKFRDSQNNRKVIEENSILYVAIYMLVTTNIIIKKFARFHQAIKLLKLTLHLVKLITWL